MQRDADDMGLSGLDQFYTACRAELRKDVEACSDEWAHVITQLRSSPANSSNDLSGQIDALLRNNGKWFVIAGKEFG